MLNAVYLYAKFNHNCLMKAYSGIIATSLESRSILADDADLLISYFCFSVQGRGSLRASNEILNSLYEIEKC